VHPLGFGFNSFANFMFSMSSLGLGLIGCMMGGKSEFISLLESSTTFPFNAL
jgi:hypothetical protein